uniref:Uncharacterized protein n=1 Tax=Heliothis virescens TaxID=7102 RepID=A0A2A4JIB3_HELVI
MPEDSKKNHDKKKGDPKDQRKPRQRHQQGGADKKAEKKTEEPKSAPKVTVPQKPVYESPPPEFFKNLKRETDEILKITEEESAKYKKKEIQSNWSKYEMPIDSYEEIEEHENMGADYEKLIQAPLSIGGHFQFKHEKSWDMNTGPSLYDKYFDINMEELNIALCSIPFYKRNSIDETKFSETDLLTMNNRSTRFKQKYYNDKSYSTPETEAQDKILRNLMKEDNVEKERDTSNDIEIKYDSNLITSAEVENAQHFANNDNLELKAEIENEPTHNVEEKVKKEETLIHETKPVVKPEIELEEEHDDLVFGNTKNLPEIKKSEAQSTTKEADCHTKKKPVVNTESLVAASVTPEVPKTKAAPTSASTEVANIPVETKKTPVIESPEDLEKWLDDFLDG